MPNKVFLDTNVVLDHLADRQPFSESAHRIFALAETGEMALCVSALSFSNLYYILRKLKGTDAARDLLRRLQRLVRIAAVGETEVAAALASSFADFEDALQYMAAEREAPLTAIVTRNVRDFATSRLPIFTPEQYLARFGIGAS